MELRDAKNPRLALQVIDDDVLLAAAQGIIDLNRLARYELASRRNEPAEEHYQQAVGTAGYERLVAEQERLRQHAAGRRR